MNNRQRDIEQTVSLLMACRSKADRKKIRDKLIEKYDPEIKQELELKIEQILTKITKEETLLSQLLQIDAQAKADYPDNPRQYAQVGRGQMSIFLKNEKDKAPCKEETKKDSQQLRM